MKVRVKNKKIFVGLLVLMISIFLILIKINDALRQKNENNKHNCIAVYVNNNKQTVIPTKDSGFAFDKAICSDNNVTVNWDSNAWQYSLSNISKSVSCNLYFSKIALLNNVAKQGDYIKYTSNSGFTGNGVSCSNGEIRNGWIFAYNNNRDGNIYPVIVTKGVSECLYFDGNRANFDIIMNNTRTKYFNNNLSTTTELICHGPAFDNCPYSWVNSGDCNTVYGITKINSIVWISGYGNIEYWGFSANSVGTRYSAGTTGGFRPIIELKSNVRVISGDGSENSPYEIAI